MVKRWPAPRTLLLAAILTGGVSIILLYTGFLTIAPLFILGFVLLCILALIALTAADIEHAQQQLEASLGQQPSSIQE